MFRTINDFLENWQYEYDSTLKLFNNITEQTKNIKVTEDGRSLSYLAWHITISILDFMNRAKLEVDVIDEKTPEPKTFEEIKLEFGKAAKLIYDRVKEKWDDNILTEESNMYGEMWSNGKILYVLIVHQVHHRGQMTVLMRQAGLKVPGIYGPSKEEWQQFGMETQK